MGPMADLMPCPMPEGSMLPPTMAGHDSTPISRHSLVASDTWRLAEPLSSAYMKMAALSVRYVPSSASGSSSAMSSDASDAIPSRARSLSLASRLLSSSLSLLMSSGSRPSPFLICL